MRVRKGASGQALGLAAAGAGIAFAAMGAGVLPAQAGQSDCAAINDGALNVALDTEASSSRTVRLEAGDKLTLRFETSDGSFGSVALYKSGRQERLLLVGPAGTSVAFVAPGQGAFDFRFARDGAEGASFSAACLPAHIARREARRGRSARTPSLLPQAALDETAEIEVRALGDVAVDARQTAGTGERAPAPLPAAAPKDPETALVFKMEPRDQSRVALGPGGIQVDPAATGLNAGVNYKLQPAIMVGVLAQLDQSGETLRGAPSSNFADHGWMAGPTAKVQFAPGLTLDAQAAWGQAESGFADLGERGPSLPRRTVSAKLANTQTIGALRFSPSISVNRSWDTAAVHEGTASDLYLTSTVASGRVDVGPEVAYRFDLANAAFLEPRIAVGSFWGLDGPAAPALHPGLAEMRLKAEAGLTLGIADGTKLQVGGTIEEGTATTPDTWSGRLQMSVPLK